MLNNNYAQRDLNTNTIHTLSDIYRRMADDRSKKLFLSRILFNVTREDIYLKQLLEDYTRHYLGAYIDDIRDSSQSVSIYGAGNCAESLYKILAYLDIKVECFYDRNVEKQGTEIFGRPVLPPPANTNRPIIVAIDYAAGKQAYNQLMQSGISESLLSLFQTSAEYFEDEIIRFCDAEVFVDGGCYNFANSESLLQLCGGVKKIYAFEPNPHKKATIEAAIARNRSSNVEFLDKGLWSGSGQLKFNIRENASASRLNDDGETIVNVTSVDDVVTGPVTFIKLDIEGAELEALKGAKDTILKYKPKLAICVYHKPEDIVDIPLYILSLVPEYKIYLRHYSVTVNDTVLYAVL